MEKICWQLLEVCVECPCGAVSLPSQRSHSVIPASLYPQLEWFQFETWLQQELLQRKLLPTTITPENQTENLQKEKFEKEIENNNVKLLLERLHQTEIFQNSLMNEKQKNEDNQTDIGFFNTIKFYINEQVKLRDQKSKEVCQLQQELITLQSELNKYRNMSANLGKENRDLIETLKCEETTNHNQLEEQTLSSRQKERMESSLKEERNKNSLLKNIFQKLVIESGINWAQDPKLRTLFIQSEFVSNK